MSQLKRLAGDTAIYGVSSILGRSINYLLVILHTSVFAREALGVISFLYAGVAIINVIYTFGMETAFFRFVNKTNSKKAYDSAATVVILISTVVSALIILFAEPITQALPYEDIENYVIWLAIILWIDGILAIPFAKLRQENKAKLFASVKVGNILINVILQLVFLLIIPSIGGFTSIYDPSIGVGYIILANLIANAMILPMLWKYLFSVRIKIDKEYLKPMLAYAFPILLMGLAGMINEMLDKILIENLLPDTFYPDMDSTGALGVYSQTFKLSIFMMLGIQAFRYAGEPFFFNNAEDKNAPELFARVMHYFVVACLVVLILVSLNVNLIAEIFLRQPEYRVALYIVPILLFGKLFFGIYVNLNIWFKLTDKTIYGTHFSMMGAVVTVLGNVILIPIIGFLGSAITSVLCYFTMALACYLYGRKYYPIPYKFQNLLPYFIGAVVISVLSLSYNHDNFLIDSSIRIIISVLIILLFYKLEKPKLVSKTS